jgi:hypothetical protein
LSFGVARFSLETSDIEVDGDIERLGDVWAEDEGFTCNGDVEAIGLSGLSGSCAVDGVAFSTGIGPGRGFVSSATFVGPSSTGETGRSVVEYAGGGVSGRSKVAVSNVGGGFSKIDFGILNGFGFSGSA